MNVCIAFTQRESNLNYYAVTLVLNKLMRTNEVYTCMHLNSILDLCIHNSQHGIYIYMFQ